MSEATSGRIRLIFLDGVYTLNIHLKENIELRKPKMDSFYFVNITKAKLG